MSKKISSYAELLDYAEGCFRGTNKIDSLEIGDSLDYKIKITGGTWDGSVDYRLAQYIIDTQNALDKLFKELGIELKEHERPIIKFRVESGCTELYIKISEAVKTLFENMPSGQKTFIAALMLLSIVGAFTAYGFMQYKTQQEQHLYELEKQKIQNEKELKHQEILVKTIDSLADKISTYETPNRKLAKNLYEGDKFENSTNPEELTKEELKQQYRGKSKSKAETVYIDNKYLITAIKLKAGKITIEHAGHRYDCQSSLNLEELEDLLNRVKAGIVEGKGFELDLKINAEYYKETKKLKNLIIYEIGTSRKNAKSIDDLINIKQEASPNRQYPLF